MFLPCAIEDHTEADEDGTTKAIEGLRGNTQAYAYEDEGYGDHRICSMERNCAAPGRVRRT